MFRQAASRAGVGRDRARCELTRTGHKSSKNLVCRTLWQGTHRFPFSFSVFKLFRIYTYCMERATRAVSYTYEDEVLNYIVLSE